jgi:inner membrane protein
MLLPSHLATGQAAYLGACVAFGHAPVAQEAIVSLIAAALPDLDCRAGIVGRALPPMSEWLERRFGHRTFTHSLILQAGTGIGLYYLLPWGFFLAFMAGWVSHTFTDMMTPAGVGWFWPSRVRCVLPGNERYRMKPMGWGELAFLVMVGLVSVLFHNLATVNAGTSGVISAAIGDLADARADYDASKGSNAWSLRVEGKDNRTFQNIAGRYPVIGGYKESGFILESAAGPVSACKTETCDWYISHAVLVRGKPIQTKTTFIKLGGIEAGQLWQQLAGWEMMGEVYLSGELEAAGIEERPPTVEAVGTEGIRLNYARAEWLKDLDNTRLRNVDLVAQLRIQSGAEAGDLDIEGDSRRCLHPLLAKWTGDSGKSCP